MSIYINGVLDRRREPTTVLVGAAQHRVRLARARLPIGEQAHVEAVQRALHKRPHLCVRVCVCVCVYIYVHMYKYGDCGRYHTPERALHTRPHAINDVYMHAYPHARAHDLSARARTSSKTCSCDESCPKHRSKLKAARTLLCSTTSWLVSPSTCTGHAPSSRPAMRVCVCVCVCMHWARALVAPSWSHPSSHTDGCRP